jgi:hypothetical protein
MMEYLIRKNLDPTRIDGDGRSALHIAVKSDKIDAVRFLVKCGCDPYQLDKEKTSPVAIAVDMQNRELVAVMKREQRIKNLRERRKVCCIPSNALNNDGRVPPSPVIEVIGGQQREDEVSYLETGDIQNSRLSTLLGSISTGSPHTDITLYTGTIDISCRPHALCRSKPSRFSYALLYALIVVGLWILTVCIPFYAWLVLMTLVFLLLRYASFITRFCIPMHISVNSIPLL